MKGTYRVINFPLAIMPRVGFGFARFGEPRSEHRSACTGHVRNLAARPGFAA
jgi:hypothetical protein